MLYISLYLSGIILITIGINKIAMTIRGKLK